MPDSIAVPHMSYPVVTSEILHAYAQASGDHNPIHLDNEIAKQFGLPGRIAHGMLIAGWVSDCATRFCHTHFGHSMQWVFRDLQFRFKGMTLMGDQVTVSGSAHSANSIEGEWSLELVACNQRGETLVTAQLILVVTGPPAT